MTKPVKPSHSVGGPSSLNFAESRQIAERLTASELRYRRLFEAAQDGILILDAATGMIVDVNPFLTTLLGFSHEQFLGKKIWELGFFRDIIANQDNFAELQRKEYLRYEDLPLETADGRRIEVEFISNVYLVDKGKVIQCNIRDITGRKQVKEELRALALRYETLLAAVPEIIMEVDQNKVYIWANQAGKEFFGDDAIGKEADFYFEGEQETYQTVQPLFNGGENTIRVESWQRRKDGAKRLLAWRCRMLRDGHNNVTGALSSALDITEQRQNEAALQEKMAELERFNRLAVGREERMIELKRQVNMLAAALGQTPPYDLSFADAAAQPPVKGKPS